MSEDPIVRELQKYSTCDVADALLKLKWPNGGFLNNIISWSPKRQEGPSKIVGPAYTVQYVEKQHPGPSPQSHYIDSIPRGSTVFISSPRNVVNAVYGGLMSTRAKYSGAVGTIVDGKIRDLQEHRDLDYPVFAKSVGTTAPLELLRVTEINEPVKLQDDDQDVVINPGDYLIGDLNGVVCIPRSLASSVVALIPSEVEADEKIAIDIENGISFSTASKQRRASVKKPEDLSDEVNREALRF